MKAQTTSKWVKTRCAKIHFPKELIRSLDVGGPIAPPGSPWGECWMFPDPAPKVPVGFGLDPFPIGASRPKPGRA